MRQIVLILIIFLAVSTLALFFMKAIVWVLLQWGAKFAVLLAIFLSTIYLWCYRLVSSIQGFVLGKKALAWVWVIGFIELLLLGGLYHLTPQFFPSWAGNFFFQ
tara:strand:+ start:429 stop:740 length:312 start_codon:yes stop_codon:yes gene_type:complete